jgi:beta-lactamase regulating signal transducer with metallopeptidase domain
MTWMIEVAVKMSVLLVVGLLATSMPRRGSAALRHWVLASTIYCAGAIPLMALMMPTWNLPALAPAAQPRAPESRVMAGANPDSVLVVAATPAAQTPERAMRRLSDAAIPIWLTGAVLNVGILLVSMGRLKAVASGATRMRAPSWQEALTRISRTLGITRPVTLLVSGHPALLVTWGRQKPTVLLPAGAERWSPERTHVVLAHELAHVAREDWLIQIGAELLRCVYWFHPLLWLASRRLRHESEHACDDAVMQAGVESRTYATHLLDIARTVHTRTLWFPAPTMAGRPSTLERRIHAMLNHRLNHAPLTRVGRSVSALALLVLTLSVAAFAQGSFGSVYGVVVDPMDRLLPGTTITLTDQQRQVKHEVRTDRDGRFELIGLPIGAYSLEAKIPGFLPQTSALTVSGQAVERNLRLEVGTLQETITVTGRPGTIGAQRSAPRTATRRPIPPCPALASPVGGNIRPPHKVKDVRPIYPGVDGHVTLAARIGTNGSVVEVLVVTSDRPELEAPAIAAVSQWEFDETLLNCVPVEVQMNVDVDFRPEQ